MCSTSRCHRFSMAGFPIRISPDHRLYTAPRGFSQCPTSFFGTWRLGILRKPLVASLRDAEKSKLFSFFCAFLLSFFLHFIQLVRCSAVLLPGQSLCPAVARSALRPPPSDAHLNWQPLQTTQPGKPPGCLSPSPRFTKHVRLDIFLCKQATLLPRF